MDGSFHNSGMSMAEDVGQRLSKVNLQKVALQLGGIMEELDTKERTSNVWNEASDKGWERCSLGGLG
jgi:hypothetical protein